MSKRQGSNPLYDGIRSLVLSARQSAARGVDLLQVYTNYEIGRRIVEQEQQGADRALYGRELLKELAARLTGEFGNGFSVSNLRYMRQFYLAYPGRIAPIRQTVSGEFPAFPNAQRLSAPIHQTLSGELGQTVFGQLGRPGIRQTPSGELARCAQDKSSRTAAYT